ncbi:MAG: indole-3-glycerol phosphate synthase TrpC [Bacteroidales bacterium]|jgi:indole-3-glycerol phosphate synthase|nr:indole-3-glycerol phosphate synthase TrpC [Bacteroidales bacterium]
MDILDKIIAHKRKEVAKNKVLTPIKLLEKGIYFERPILSLSRYLQMEDTPRIIAEIKRKSPSKGMINENIDVKELSTGYIQAGAAALSVLTDNAFFYGSNEDLMIARKYNGSPILRKDFIIDEYQILEAKSIGADAILLIASVLNPSETRKLAQFANGLGLEVLLEVHNEAELQKHPNEYVNIIGVNNRNLKTFEVDIQTSVQLSDMIPDNFLKISESGISSPTAIHRLINAGFNGFLVGEYFMQSPKPHLKCNALIQSVKELKN